MWRHCLRASAAFCRSGYDGYNILVRPDRRGGPVILAYCWAHLRRRFYEIAAKGPAPIAQNALERIQKLYKIEEEIRGRTPEERCAIRQARARPEVEALKSWFEDCLKRVSKSSPVRDAIQYGLNQWDGLNRSSGGGTAIFPAFQGGMRDGRCYVPM